MQAQFHYLQKHALKMLTLAIYHGDIVPATHCQNCGVSATNRELDGHHEDYSKPLEVIWLCRICHKKEHNRDGQYNHRNAPKMKKAIEWMKTHPEHIDTESRVLADLIGVSHTLANDARKVVKSSNNGHIGN